MKISDLSAPSFIAWQITRDCNLACIHCCTDSAPGRPLPHELLRQEALCVADQIISAQVPYVLLAGGEPAVSPYFLELAETLGKAGVYLKIETNGQAFGEKEARVLAGLPVRSLQISLDGSTQAVYSKIRPGGSLDRVVSACRIVRSFNLPLEITFVPTQLNIHEAETVMDLALSLGAFRFNTGSLMRLGTAAKFWDRLSLSCEEREKFYNLLVSKEMEFKDRMEIMFRPFSIEEEISSRKGEFSAALLILPDGKVRVSAFLPYTCADLRRDDLSQAWKNYQKAHSDPRIAAGFANILRDNSVLADANRFTSLKIEMGSDLSVVV
jgi:MoaA/NifB/PqqE/SkfB family radical SAM enzyme